MVFVYHGNYKELKKEVADAQETISNKYAEVLGPERTKRLKVIADRTLGPESYFEDIDQVNALAGTDVPEETPSKFILLNDASSERHPNGRLKKLNVRLAPAFYVSETSFRHSGSSDFTDRPIATYVHEFNHFALFMLQRTPLALAEQFLTVDIGGPKRKPQDLLDLAGKSLTSGVPIQEAKDQLAHTIYSFVLNDCFERSNKILDRIILETVGIDVPLDWRGKPRQYAVAPMLAPYFAIGIPTGGDPFLGLDDSEALDRFIRWDEYLNIMATHKTPRLDNLMESLKDLRVELMPVWELKAESIREHEEYEAKQQSKIKKKTFKRRKK